MKNCLEKDLDGWPRQSSHITDSNTCSDPGNWPKISVITPSFNQGDFLEETILSVIHQNYPNLEYIVIDGGSNDQSLEVLNRYSRHFTYWYSRKDKGQADAIATGFDKSSGEILCWLNSDDIFLPNTLKTIGEFFKRNGKVDFAYGNRMLIDHETRVTGTHTWLRILNKYHWNDGLPMAQECCFWRRDIYFRAGGINRSLFFIMDLDLFYRMWCVGRFKKINQFLGCLRTHSQSKNTKFQTIRLEEMQVMKQQLNLAKRRKIVNGIYSRFDRAQIWFEKRISRRPENR